MRKKFKLFTRDVPKNTAVFTKWVVTTSAVAIALLVKERNRYRKISVYGDSSALYQSLTIMYMAETRKKDRSKYQPKTLASRPSVGVDVRIKQSAGSSGDDAKKTTMLLSEMSLSGVGTDAL